MITIKPKYDVVILGAGHNGLVAASYLGRAGLSRSPAFAKASAWQATVRHAILIR